MATINLKQLSVDNLLTLRDRINSMLESRVDRERRDLESRLKRLQRFKVGTAKPGSEKPVTAAAKKLAKKNNKKSIKKVAPKFRNPENHSETWSGRGLQPRWMRAAMDGGGRSLEDFRI